MSEEETPFAKALQSLLKSTTRVEGLAEELVSAAVRDTIEAIATDYNLDGQVLKEMYEEQIVARYSSLHSQHRSFDARFCTAMTRANKRCTKPAVFKTFCKVHAAAHLNKDKEEQQQHASIAAYVERLSQMPGPSQA